MREISTQECHTRFGEFMREARLNREEPMLQSELADKVGVTQTYISRLERGERNIDLDLALKICDALDVNIQKFILLYMR